MECPNCHAENKENSRFCSNCAAPLGKVGPEGASLTLTLETPAHVLKPGTLSAGYTLMYYLYRAGAKIVGTPSAQAGNCFGEATSFTLQHSQLTGTISHKQCIYFHDDPEMGRILRPHYPMTYDKLKSYVFDLNADILYALDLCRR